MPLNHQICRQIFWWFFSFNRLREFLIAYNIKKKYDLKFKFKIKIFKREGEYVSDIQWPDGALKKPVDICLNDTGLLAVTCNSEKSNGNQVYLYQLETGDPSADWPTQNFDTFREDRSNRGRGGRGKSDRGRSGSRGRGDSRQGWN